MDTYWVPGVNNLGTYRPLGVRRVQGGLRDRGGVRRAKIVGKVERMTRARSVNASNGG